MSDFDVSLFLERRWTLFIHEGKSIANLMPPYQQLYLTDLLFLVNSMYNLNGVDGILTNGRSNSYLDITA